MFSISARASSAVAFVFPNGADLTMIPFSVAAFRSMLSVPTPARLMTLSLPLTPFSIISRVTFVALLTIRASNSLI